MQHPSLIERSVGATLRAFSKGQVTREEAELDLIELIASQMVGKTDYIVAVVGYYVKALLDAVSRGHIDFTAAFETLVDAALTGAEYNIPLSARLATPFLKARTDSGMDRVTPIA